MTSQTFLTAFIIVGLGFRIARLCLVIRQSKSRGSGHVAARPIFWIMTSFYLAYVSICAWEGFHRTTAFSWTLSFAGLAAYAGALSLRELAMRDLGRFFSPDIEIRTGHRVIREGLYGYVRHPLLACMGLEILGLGVVFNAYKTLIVFGIGVYWPLILIRKTLEERTLLFKLGDSYRQYKRDVGAFWPRLSNPLSIHQGARHV